MTELDVTLNTFLEETFGATQRSNPWGTWIYFMWLYVVV